MNGAHHFNEVILDGAFVPDAMVFGELGQGLASGDLGLAFERSGPERFLSTFMLLATSAEAMSAQGLARDAGIGRLLGRIAGLHQMSSAVAGALERHDSADVAAAVVRSSGRLPKPTSRISPTCSVKPSTKPTGGSKGLVAAAVDQRPGFTLRGGTNEVMRGVIARDWGCDDHHRDRRRPGGGRHDGWCLRRAPGVSPPTVVAERDVELWHALDDLGLVRLTGDEASGGSGAGWYEAAGCCRRGARGVRIPLAGMICWPAGSSTPSDCPPTTVWFRTVCRLDERGSPQTFLGWRAPTASSWCGDPRIPITWPTSTPRRWTSPPGQNLIGEPRHTSPPAPGSGRHGPDCPQPRG